MMMEKTFGLVMLALALVTPAIGVIDESRTYQCWDFNQQTNRSGISPSVNGNIHGGSQGGPVAMLADMSGTGLVWGDGKWFGQEFKIILDIPNQPIANPYKLLWINMMFQGDVAFSWVADAISGNKFTLLEQRIEESPTAGWKKLYQEWRFEPNPREEIVVIGLKSGGAGAAAIDQICVETWCVPEPATLAILGAGAAIATIRRRKKV